MFIPLKNGGFIHASLGENPGSKMDVLRQIRNALKDVKSGRARDVDLKY